MARVPTLDTSKVEAYKDLPVAVYEGTIDKVTYRAPKQEGKFPQLMATYAVTSGENAGRKSSEFVSMSPNAVQRWIKWWGKLGFEQADIPADLEIDEEGGSFELLEPDLVGIDIEFRVYRDGNKWNAPDEPNYRTELIRAMDLDEPAAAPKAAAKDEPADEPDDAPDDEPVETEKPAARAASPARRAAAPGRQRRALR
jgi:hypothetical protein